jgi:hypothetical protein
MYPAGFRVKPEFAKFPTESNHDTQKHEYPKHLSGNDESRANDKYSPPTMVQKITTIKV